MKLDVMHIMQEKQNNCWYASARILYGYRKSASINTLPQEYENDQGLQPEQFIALAQDIGLDTLPQVNQSFSWRFIDDSLRAYGLIWAAGQWNRVNHIVVIYRR